MQQHGVGIRTWGWQTAVLGGLRILLVGSLLLGLGMLGSTGDGWAQPDPTANWSTGKVTATFFGKQSIQINGRDYLLDPKVTMRYDTGGAISLEQGLARGDRVRFRLKDGRVRELVVIQPG
ncbi:MAG: hypothetical protein ACREI9_04760 [Nitrospiraceae bacterium]